MPSKPIKREFQYVIEHSREPIYIITRGNLIYAFVFRRIVTLGYVPNERTILRYIYELEYSDLRYHELSEHDRESIKWLFNNIVSTQCDDVCKTLHADIPERVNDVLPITFKVENYES